MNENASGLSRDQSNEIRSELLRAKSTVERSLKITNKAARPVKLDQTSFGRLSCMDANQNQSLTQGFQEREQTKRAEIVGALTRIDEGTYGTCTGCNHPIGFAHLLISPETQMSADCAS